MPTSPKLLISDEPYAQALAQMNQRYGAAHGKQVLDRTLWMAFESAVKSPAIKATVPELPDIPGMETMKERIRKSHERMGQQFTEMHRLGIIKLINLNNELDGELAGRLADEIIRCANS